MSSKRRQRNDGGVKKIVTGNDNDGDDVPTEVVYKHFTDVKNRNTIMDVKNPNRGPDVTSADVIYVLIQQVYSELEDEGVSWIDQIPIRFNMQPEPFPKNFASWILFELRLRNLARMGRNLAKVWINEEPIETGRGTYMVVTTTENHITVSIRSNAKHDERWAMSYSFEDK